MTKEEAKLMRLEPNSGNDAYNSGIKSANRRASHIIDKMNEDFEKEKQKIKKEAEYWKLSFRKQVEALRENGS